MNIVQKGEIPMPKIIEEPREAILYHAKNIVVDEGIELLTIRKVAKSADISVGTIYNYFPTKRDLTIQLMEDYWGSYLNVIDQIDQQQPDFYKKMLQIYQQLEIFVKTFKEVWIKNSSSNHPDEPFVKRKYFFDKLSKRLEDILVAAESSGAIKLSIDTYTIAQFLMLNYFMMSMMNQFNYESFEKIIKKLFQ
jgi:AcrR family transcriptional regulator